jgi:hypothetical protein
VPMLRFSAAATWPWLLCLHCSSVRVPRNLGAVQLVWLTLLQRSVIAAYRCRSLYDDKLFGMSVSCARALCKGAGHAQVTFTVWQLATVCLVVQRTTLCMLSTPQQQLCSISSTCTSRHCAHKRYSRQSISARALY